MKSGRIYNKKDNEVFMRDNEDGSIDIISDDWDEFKSEWYYLDEFRVVK